MHTQMNGQVVQCVKIRGQLDSQELVLGSHHVYSGGLNSGCRVLGQVSLPVSHLTGLSLELQNLLFSSLKCWNYRGAPVNPLFMVPGTEHSAVFYQL